jgi:TonB family protein
MAMHTLSHTPLDTTRISPTLLYSIAFHLLVFVVIPVTTLLWRKPQHFQRPQTFQLVRAPMQSKAVLKTSAHTARPKSKSENAIRPATKSDNLAAKKTPKPQPEDVSDLEDLLEGMAQPVSNINVGSGFTYDWYKNNLQIKIEQFWKPAVDNPDLAVQVAFTVLSDGSITPVAIRKSSGNAAIDRQALRAVELAAPFGHLPPAYKGDLMVEMTLIATNRK